ncbi:unnamed protein product [Prunus armeniaca]
MLQLRHIIRSEVQFSFGSSSGAKPYSASLWLLAYGASEDQVDEIAKIGKSTILECLIIFCDEIETIYMRDYLCKPTPRDLQMILQKDEQIGFQGMIGSIDCMYWQRKNCPTA